MNYYKVRIELHKNGGYQEVGVYYLKAKAIDCIKRIMSLNPYHWEITRGRRIILKKEALQ